jgi:hypothetical protein
MGAGAIPIDIEKAFRQREQSNHKLEICTAPYDYAGKDRVDVSFNGGNFVLTPPRHMLFDYRMGRLSQEQFRQDYFKFLEGSFIQNKYNWDNLLDSRRIVLVCSCGADDATCHRHFLIEFLTRFGAIYHGAIAPKKTKPAKAG